MSSNKFKKPYVVRFKIDEFLLATMYLCYFYKIPLDLLIAMYEKFGRQTLFFFKALTCKGYVKLSDTQFCEIIESCKILYSQIKKKQIDKTQFNDKMVEFINYLTKNSENLFDYEIRFFFDLNDFYNGNFN